MLIYVVIPAVIFAVVAGLAMSGGGRRGRRYRPGRPYEFTPVWFLSNPERGAPGHGRELPAGGAASRALPGTTQERPAGPRGTGGASDRW